MPDAVRARRRAPRGGRRRRLRRRSIVLHVSAGNPFRRWPAASFAGAGRDARRRQIRRGASSSPPGRPRADAAEAVAGAGARAGRRRRPRGIVRTRRVRPVGAARAGRSRGALHRRRQRAAARRRHHRARRSSRCSGRRCPSDRCRGAIRRSARIAVDAGPLPCRPCHQRHCVPGDFRCLTAISPTDGASTACRQRWDGLSWSTDDHVLRSQPACRRAIALEQIGLLRRSSASSPPCSCRLRRRRSCWRVAALCWLASHLSRRRAARGAAVLLAARRLRGADAGVGRLLARSARQLHRLQAAGAADARADRLRLRARRARQLGAEHRS